jgi:hypothetical protein
MHTFTVLSFDVPVLSPQPASPTTQMTSTETALSLPASLYHLFAGLLFDQNLLSSPTPGPPHIGVLDPSRLGYHDKLGNTLPVVVDVVNGGDASAVAGIVVVQVADSDGGAAHDVTDVAVADGGAAHDVDVVELVVVDGVATHDFTDVVVDEHDGGQVAMVVDDGGEPEIIVDCAVQVVDCAPASGV